MATGKSSSFVWDYSRSDILNIHKADKKVAGSSELGDFTVDFDKEGNIIGVEITNASEFLSQVGISPEQLDSLHGAELILNQKDHNVTFILIKLRLPTGEQTIPLPAPITASVEE